MNRTDDDISWRAYTVPTLPVTDPSFVYLIGNEANSLVKIGFSKNVSRRLSELDRMSPVRLTLLATFPGGKVLETLLHVRFATYRTRGEWFDVDPSSVILAVTGDSTFDPQ